MQTFLYNLNTQQREGPIRNGHYLVDGQPGVLPDYLVELEITRLPNPPYNYDIETLVYRSYADLNNFKWIEEAYARPLTEQEIRERIGDIPSVCTPRQLRIALIQTGISLSMIQAFIDSIQDPIQKEIAIVEWEYALEIHRQHPLVLGIAANLNLTQKQIDDIFVLAGTL